MKNVLLAVFLMVTSSALHAETAEEKGLSISQEAQRRDNGWADLKATMVMVLRNSRGEESSRRVEIRSLEVAGDGDKSLTIFSYPADIKGTVFLSHTHPTRPDEQWLYLPALKRIKRISSSNKSGPFMGSEFAYEDLASQEIEKYSYRYLRNVTYQGQDHFIIERYPEYKRSGYKRQVVWLDVEHYRVTKIEFFDRKDSLLKVLTCHGYTQYLGRYWRANEMRMENKQTGKSTVLQWSDYAFQSGLNDRDFDRNALKRIR